MTINILHLDSQGDVQLKPIENIKNNSYTLVGYKDNETVLYKNDDAKQQYDERCSFFVNQKNYYDSEKARVDRTCGWETTTTTSTQYGNEPSVVINESHKLVAFDDNLNVLDFDTKKFEEYLNNDGCNGNKSSMNASRNSLKSSEQRCKGVEVGTVTPDWNYAMCAYPPHHSEIWQVGRQRARHAGMNSLAKCANFAKENGWQAFTYNGECISYHGCSKNSYRWITPYFEHIRGQYTPTI